MDKFKEFLIKQGLTEDQANGIIKGMGSEKIYLSENENIDERYNKLKTQKEDLEGQIKTANTTIADLKKNHTDNEALQQTIKEHEAALKTQKEEYEGKIKNMAFDTAINNWLTANNAKHGELLAARFDRSKLTLKESGEVEGLEEQAKGIKETFKDLFVTDKNLGGQTPPNPNPPGGGAGGGVPGQVTKEQFDKMGYMEKVQLYNENPALYQNLRGE